MSPGIAIGMLLCAIALDLLLGDPQRAHPVALIGAGMDRCATWLGPPASIGIGALFVLTWLLAVGAAGWMAEQMLAALTPWLAILLGGLLLWPAFAIRALTGRVAEIRDLLRRGNLDGARTHLGRHLVSRDTTNLDGADIAGAAIASLFENLCDSVVAPLFWFAIAGLPGAWAYRVVNTADAMFGYRHGVLERFGAAAARLDDLLNWIPARLTGSLIWLVGGRAGSAAGWRQDRTATPSPNGGWPMAAAAWRLGLCIDKPGVYALNRSGKPAAAADIDRALALAARSLWAALPLAIALASLFHG